MYLTRQQGIGQTFRMEIRISPKENTAKSVCLWERSAAGRNAEFPERPRLLPLFFASGAGISQNGTLQRPAGASSNCENFQGRNRS